MIGIIANVLCVALGGLAGALFGHKLTQEFKDTLTSIFGICSIGMGVSSIMLMENMPAVILALVLGTSLGILLHVGRSITRCAGLLEKPIARIFGAGTHSSLPREEYLSMLVTVIVLFCSSGTGIYGSLDAGMTGSVTILMSKSILDLFTAMIFACSLGAVVAVVAVPQLVIFLCLFLAAEAIYPLTTPMMIADFKACGGFLLIATGLRIAKIREFPIADMIPAMVLVMPLSSLWASYVAPLLG